MKIQIMLKLLHILEQLRQHERWTRPQLEAHQTATLHRLRDCAYAHSPFYQKYHRGLESAPLAKLPVLTKATLMENFDDLVTDRAIRLETVRDYLANFREDRCYLDRYWVNATSGSTGQVPKTRAGKAPLIQSHRPSQQPENLMEESLNG